jgi:hypothetical protein
MIIIIINFEISRPNINSAQVECESESDTVITGATGTISESLSQYWSNIPGKHEIKELEKQPYWSLHYKKS